MQAAVVPDAVKASGLTLTGLTIENGDKILSESTGTSQTTVAPDSSKKSSTEEGTEIWTGGADGQVWVATSATQGIVLRP